jgi:hypothetical protein
MWMQNDLGEALKFSLGCKSASQEFLLKGTALPETTTSTSFLQDLASYVWSNTSKRGRQRLHAYLSGQRDKQLTLIFGRIGDSNHARKKKRDDCISLPHRQLCNYMNRQSSLTQPSRIGSGH